MLSYNHWNLSSLLPPSSHLPEGGTGCMKLHVAPSKKYPLDLSEKLSSHICNAVPLQLGPTMRTFHSAVFTMQHNLRGTSKRSAQNLLTQKINSSIGRTVENCISNHICYTQTGSYPRHPQKRLISSLGDTFSLSKARRHFQGIIQFQDNLWLFLFRCSFTCK